MDWNWNVEWFYQYKDQAVVLDQYEHPVLIRKVWHFPPRLKNFCFGFAFCKEDTGSINTKFLRESKTAAGKKIGIVTTFFLGVKTFLLQFYETKYAVAYTGSMFYLLCLDSCLQTYVLRKIKTARFMLCMFTIKHNMKWNMKNQVLPSASYVINMNHNMGFFHG